MISHVSPIALTIVGIIYNHGNKQPTIVRKPVGLIKFYIRKAM
jgi:hypothetical protein